MNRQQTQKLSAQNDKFDQRSYPNAEKKGTAQEQWQRKDLQSQLEDKRKQEVKEQIDQHQKKKKALARTKGKIDKKRRSSSDREKKIFSLYDTKQSHPIIEYLPSKEDSESATLTPSFVLEVTWPRVVQFYHPSSPRCQALQSIYVAVARGIKRRSSRLPVEFHAINCGVYREVCEQGFNVKSVPTIIGLRSGRIDGTEITLPGSMGAGASGSNEDRAKDVELKVEFIAQMMGIPLDIVKGHSGAAFARPMGVDVDSGIDVDLPENDIPGEDSIESSIPITDQAFHDAKSSLLATLTSSIYSQFPRGSALPLDTSRALEEFLDLIRWAFPPETQVHDLAEDLKLDYLSVSASEDGLMNVVDRHIYMGSGIAWSRRCGAQSNGGYSCGLWTLLHILSIGVAERHTSVVGYTERISVVHAGQVMRSFIDKFFIGCNTCKESWKELYDEACCGLYSNDHSMVHTSEVVSKTDDWRNLAIWIWEVHNEITVLRQKSVGKGIYRKQSHMASSSSLWPSKKDCPKCWRSLTDDTGLVMNMDSYDRNELYNHLKKTYWPGGVHNNRLIVLDRWSKAKRALSMKRLRARMATHDWPISVLFLHILVAYLVLRIAFPRWSLHMTSRILRWVMSGESPIQKRNKNAKKSDQCNMGGRCSGKSDRNSDYVRNKYSTTQRSRQSMHLSEHKVPNRSGNVLRGYNYSSRSHEGRRRFSIAGSGHKQSTKHDFKHFLEL